MQLQAFLITFREVLEALLIVGIITTYLKRTDNKKFVKYVWLGAGMAVLASFLVALLFQVVFTGFAAMGSEMYLKIGIIFVSAVLLTQMVFWMAEHSKNIKANVEGKMSHYITTGNVIGMVVHSFLVVLREGVETVFFFAAITGGNIGAAFQGWGAVSGLLVASVVAYMFFKGTMRVSLKTFFKVTGVFIVMIAAGLLVQGVSMLQDIKLLGSVMPHVYDITWFLPEHPIDYEHYLRDNGVAPLLSGDIGIFLKAFLGYSSMPSIEEVIVYLGYFVVIYMLVTGKKPPVEEKKAQVNRSVS
ncbi:FTR1 family protein [Ectobacillus antri]|uniref:FTR1 family protein n=1 Tax=Ectobacillus antri TaxID=2486280 RepID=A0ABT6H2K1_9BACI|nr:FTR1 family protein [Ectobacillus antri]MDG4656580.1 FTR1 family protein [Ectobacillus antri]MDG5753630.1 FTR1 family protein [Ectobacillus antri]